LSTVPALPRRAFLAVFGLSIPTVTNIVFGQVDLIIFSGLLGGYLLMRSGRPVLAGCALAVVMIKPQFLAGVIPMLALRREWRTLLALTGTGFGALILPTVLLPDAFRESVSLLRQYLGAGDGLQVNPGLMSNWRGFVVSASGRSEAWIWLPGAVTITAGAYAVCVTRWRVRPS